MKAVSVAYKFASDGKFSSEIASTQPFSIASSSVISSPSHISSAGGGTYSSSSSGGSILGSIFVILKSGVFLVLSLRVVSS